MKRKALFVTTRLPFQETDGRRRLLFNYCRIFFELGYEVRVISSRDDEGMALKRPDFISNAKCGRSDVLLLRLFRVCCALLTLKKIPFQVVVAFSRKVQKLVDDEISNWLPDIVICDMVRSVPYVTKYRHSVPTIANLDDLLSIRYERQSRLRNPSDFWGGKKSGWMLSVPLVGQVFKWILRSETRRLRDYEKWVASQFSQVTLVSETEVYHLKRVSGVDRVFCWSMGVDVDWNVTAGSCGRPSVSFLGVMDAPHNLAAVRYFVEEIWPLVLRELPNSEFRVIGKGSDGNVAAEFSSVPNIVFVGQVDDVGGELRKSDVFVAPLVFGSGIKTKVLEAMARGLPVVATSVALEGIDATDGVELFCRDAAQDFASALVGLLRDSAQRQRIGQAGREFVSNRYGWNVVKRLIQESTSLLVGGAEDFENEAAGRA
ncbi:glycosyltransferase [Alicyclobacillus acidiphilus]|uniref:glycosyltransferase n=1 Tax=Alicyclobacillus acidiphilus TaxID=182455 RepID=UPI0008343D52|nr:glycosyltransferase family 4 protein [Alicyclobacillus acidiphilus]